MKNDTESNHDKISQEIVERAIKRLKPINVVTTSACKNSDIIFSRQIPAKDSFLYLSTLLPTDSEVSYSQLSNFESQIFFYMNGSYWGVEDGNQLCMVRHELSHFQ